MENPPIIPDILLEEEIAISYEPASTGQRFSNYIIDNLLMSYGLDYATGAAFGYILTTINPELAEAFINESEAKWQFVLFTYSLSIFNYLIYYTICEKLFKGCTLGKLITGSRAIREDGGALTFKDALLRSLSRIVPFEALSAFGGHPWHDRWTKTRVVKTR